MKRTRISLFAAVALLAATTSLLSCSKKDTDDIVVINPLAGDYTGTEDAGSLSLSRKTLFSPVYVVRMHNANLGNDSQMFIENIANINAKDTLVSDASLSPKERFLVTVTDGKFTIPVTTQTVLLYETPASKAAAATASNTFNTFYNTSTTPGATPVSFDLRTKFVYTIKADGAINGDILTLNHEVTNATYTRYRLRRKKLTTAAQPLDSVIVNTAASGTGDDNAFGLKAFEKKAKFIGNREYKAPIVQGG